MSDIEVNFNIEERETIEADFVIYAQTATVAWGGVVGTLSNQEDLQNALDDKVTKNDNITAGTHAKITYDAKGLVTSGADLEASDIPNLTLSKITDVTATAQELNYVDGVTSNIQTQIDNKLSISDIINNTSTTTTNQALSANMGKELNDRINDLKARGRYLSTWNCTTGLAGTTPTTLPYDYKTGDYFIVSVVGTTNFKPNGSQYTGVASSTSEIGTVAVNDTYLYDGTTWTLLHGADIQVTFSSIGGQPTDNTNLASALNAKQDNLTAGTGISIDDNEISIIQSGSSTYNVTAVGSPTNTNGVLSNFSSSDYFTTFSFSPSSSPWEIVIKFTTGSISNEQGIFGGLGTSDGCTPFHMLSSGQLTGFLSSNGSSWDILSGNERPIAQLAANTTYILKCEFTGSSYVWSKYENDTWTTLYTLASSARIFNGLVMQLGTNRGTGRPFAGTIDLNETYVKIDGGYYWKGVTIGGDVAKATASIYGLVKPDTTTITVYDGVITASSLNNLTATVTELNYMDGVTSNVQTQLNSKQATLVSGTNIKTINSTSLLGSGDLTVQASATYDSTNERLVL